MATRKKDEAVKAQQGELLNLVCAELYAQSGASPREGERVYAPATDFVAVRLDDGEKEAVARVIGVATFRGPQGGTFVACQVISGDLFEQNTRIELDSKGAAAFDVEVLENAAAVDDIMAALGLSAPDLSGDSLPARKEKAPASVKSDAPARQGIRVSR